MNILFIGPYRQADGWGIAAREYLKALRTTPHTISCRPIYMGQTFIDDIGDLEQLEKKTSRYDGSYDVVIQNCLPHLFEYHKKCGINVGLFYTESSEWINCWPDRLDIMDRLIVPSAIDVINIRGTKYKTSDLALWNKIITISFKRGLLLKKPQNPKAIKTAGAIKNKRIVITT